MHDLAGTPALASIKAQLEQQLDRHLRATGDPILSGPVPNRAGEADVPQWQEQRDGSFRLASDDPVDPGEISLT